MAALEALTGLVSIGAGIARGLKQKRMAEEEIAAEKEREASNLAQQQNQRRFAIVSALLGSDAVAPEAKNALLAAVMPDYFQRTRQIQQTIPGTQATAAPVELPGTSAKNEIGIPAIPLQSELPTEDRLPYTRMMTPVALPTKPRGTVGQAEVSLKSGPESITTKTITEPMQVFQEELKKEDKDLALSLIKQGYQLYEGMNPDDRIKFVQSLDTFRKTKNPADIFLPSSLPKDASDAEKQRLENLLMQQRTATSQSSDELNRARIKLIEKELGSPYADKVQRAELYAEAAARGRSKNEAKIKLDNLKTIAGDAQAVFKMFGEVSKAFTGPLAGRTIGEVGKFLKLDPELSAYEDLKNFMVTNFGRYLGGERGPMTEGDVNRASGLMPNRLDTGKVAARKMREAFEFIDRRVKTEQRIAGEPETGLAGFGLNPFGESTAPESAGLETSAKGGIQQEVIHTPYGDYGNEDLNKFDDEVQNQE